MEEYQTYVRLYEFFKHASLDVEQALATLSMYRKDRNSCDANFEGEESSKSVGLGTREYL